MIEISKISSYSANYNQSFGGQAKVSKTVSSVVPKRAVETGKKLTLGTIIASLFASKAKKENVQEPKTKIKNTFREERIYDKQGRLTEILKYSNADDVLSIRETINPETGNFTEKTWYKKDGINEQMRQIYDAQGDKQNLISYNNFGKVEWIETYGKKSDKPIEITWFDKNGNMSEQVKCDEETGDIENRIIFDKDANLVEISEIASLTGNIVKTTNFHKDGSKTVREFDIVTKEQTGRFDYNKNNRLVDFNVKNDTVQRGNISFNKISDKPDEEMKKIYSDNDEKRIIEYIRNREEMEFSE